MKKMSMEINNSQNIIDSRDIIERIEELQKREEEDQLDPDEQDELEALQDLASQGENLSEDWSHGATLIRDSYFTQYAQELAEDIGAISNLTDWPARHIDWKQAVEELQIDYTTLVFDGVDYWAK